MGNCCSAHLAAMVRDLAPNAKKGELLVKIVENQARFIPEGLICNYCKAPAEFVVSFDY